MDKHIPNEKELIRPRRLCLRREIPEPGTQNFACGANYLAARWFNSACGANYPYQALKATHPHTPPAAMRIEVNRRLTCGFDRRLTCG